VLTVTLLNVSAYFSCVDSFLVTAAICGGGWAGSGGVRRGFLSELFARREINVAGGETTRERQTRNRAALRFRHKPCSESSW